MHVRSGHAAHVAARASCKQRTCTCVPDIGSVGSDKEQPQICDRVGIRATSKRQASGRTLSNKPGSGSEREEP